GGDRAGATRDFPARGHGREPAGRPTPSAARRPSNWMGLAQRTVQRERQTNGQTDLTDDERKSCVVASRSSSVKSVPPFVCRSLRPSHAVNTLRTGENCASASQRASAILATISRASGRLTPQDGSSTRHLATVRSQPQVHGVALSFCSASTL